MENIEKNEITNEKESNEMRRGIKGWQVSFIGLGGVIGSCYFLGMGIVIHDMGPAVFLAFAVVGVVVYGLMISYSELLVNVPRKGSFIAYTAEFIGPTVSTGFGWAYWFNFVCYIPSEAIAVSTVVTAMFNVDSYLVYILIALGTMAALTLINLATVDAFAKIESGLAITKCIVIIVFVLVAFAIWIGVLGTNADQVDGFLGGTVNFNSGNGFMHDLFPAGGLVVITSMVNVIVTFQGTEIVGMTASEAEDPDKSVPKACKSVTIRVALFYMLPILLVLLIYPYGYASDNNSVFADIMNYYGLPAFAKIFGAIVAVAAFSCANTSFYGTVRAMYGLAIEGLAPKKLGKLASNGNPKNSVLFTLCCMWIVLILGLVSELTGAMSNLYGCLLSLSGFTGTLAWIGIILSWIVFRRKYVRRGYSVNDLGARIGSGQGWLPYFAVAVLAIFLVMMAFGEGQFIIFCVACAAVFIPMIVRKITVKLGKSRDIDALGKDEKTFDELYPDINR